MQQQQLGLPEKATCAQPGRAPCRLSATQQRQQWTADVFQEQHPACADNSSSLSHTLPGSTLTYLSWWAAAGQHAGSGTWHTCSQRHQQAVHRCKTGTGMRMVAKGLSHEVAYTLNKGHAKHTGQSAPTAEHVLRVGCGWPCTQLPPHENSPTPWVLSHQRLSPCVSSTAPRWTLCSHLAPITRRGGYSA